MRARWTAGPSPSSASRVPESRRFTVIVPIHDHALVVGEAVDSVRRQTVGDWELVVVDDGSADDGATRAACSGDARVRVIVQANAGVMAARRRGLDTSSGDLVVFLDGDDR